MIYNQLQSITRQYTMIFSHLQLITRQLQCLLAIYNQLQGGLQ
jgi:hypothetical protein